VLYENAGKVTGSVRMKENRTLSWQVDSQPWKCPYAWCVKSLRILG
jgi:hypothetical protein